MVSKEREMTREVERTREVCEWDGLSVLWKWIHGIVDILTAKKKKALLVLFCYFCSFNSLPLRVRNVYPWKPEVGIVDYTLCYYM